MTDKTIGTDGEFVGLQNYRFLLRWPDFERMFFNTWTIAIVGVVDQVRRRHDHGLCCSTSIPRAHAPARGLHAAVGAADLRRHPDMALALRLPDRRVQHHPHATRPHRRQDLFLGNPTFALIAVIILVVWKGFPFFGISYLAGMQGIPTSSTRRPTWTAPLAGSNSSSSLCPVCAHVILITCLLSLIWTSNTFEMVYLLTGGGPSNRTQVFTVMTYKLGVENMRIGEAAAVPMMFFPLLLGLIVIVSRYMLQED